MSLANRYLPYSVFLNTAGSVDAWINQVQSTNLAGGVSLFEETSGSEYDRQYVAAKEVAPTVAIETTDLTALSTVGYAGVLVNCGSGTPGCTIYARQLPLGSLPAAIGASDHITALITDGLMVPKRISAGNNEVAKFQIELHPILGTTATYSGSKPIVYTNAQTIPSGQSATSNIFSAGPVKFTVSGGSSTLLQGISQTAVDFGIQVMKETTDAEVYPSHISIIGRNARFEFTSKDPTVQATIGDGISVSAFGSYFRAVTQNGQRVAAATTSHVSVSGTAGMVTPGTFNLTHKRAGEVAYIYTPSFASSALITISVAAAIPTS